MRKLLCSSAALAALVAASVASHAGTLVPIVPVSGSSSTDVFGINDSNVITGSYIGSNDGLEHGYFGPVDGSNYTLFDAPAGKTEPRALSNDGTITGFGNNDGTPADFQPFERYPTGTLKGVVSRKEKPINYLAQGIANTTDVFAGSYYNGANALLGYLAKRAEITKGVKLSIANSGVGPRGVDSAGDIIGWYLDTNGVQNGFLISGGTTTTINYPDNTAVYTVLEGINDSGTITGQWKDTGGVIHAFTYSMATGNFKPITVPNAVSFTQAWGINTEGDVAIGSDQGYFIFCPGKKGCPLAGVHSTPIHTTESEIRIPLKDLPHVACVNGCLAPLTEQDLREIAAPHAVNVAQPQAPGRPQPMQP